MRQFNYNEYLRNNPLLKEASVSDLVRPLVTKLESMGYEVDVDPSFGFPIVEASKALPDASILRMTVQPSEGEIQHRMDQSATGKDYSTVDVEFTHWKREIVKRFFGLIKTKGDYDVKRLPDESGTDIDLGTGMFDIPIDQSVNRIIDLLRKAEQKVTGGTPTRQMTHDANTDFMGEGFNPLRKMKDFAGEKGWTFSARRPTDEEDAIGREYMESQGKKLGSIGVDRITGNINVMEPNGDFRAILSPDGEELSAYEMDIHESKKRKK